MQRTASLCDAPGRTHLEVKVIYIQCEGLHDFDELSAGSPADIGGAQAFCSCSDN
jgi:hypothetical protein